MKILSATFAAALLAVAAPTGTTIAQVPSDYTRCFFQNIQDCYPIDDNGFIYIPNPETPEGMVFDQCVAAVEAYCASQFPS